MRVFHPLLLVRQTTEREGWVEKEKRGHMERGRRVQQEAVVVVLSSHAG